MGHAIQSPPRIREDTTAETQIPWDSATESSPLALAGGGELLLLLVAEPARVGANGATDRVGLVELLDGGSLFEAAPVVLVQDDHQVVRLVGLLLLR